MSNDDLSDDDIESMASADVMAVVPCDARAMAREIQRRRAEEQKVKEMVDDKSFMTEVVKQAATARLLASMVKELRWYESDIDALLKGLSATAREVYDRYVEALAQHEAFEAGWKFRIRNRRGITTDTMLTSLREEAETMNTLADASREYARVVVPELRTIIEQKQRVFDGARKVETEEYAPTRAAEPKTVRVELKVGGLTTSFRSPQSFRIGRLQSCNLVLVGTAVGRIHSDISADNFGNVVITDLGHGVLVNGKSTNRAVLKTGDVIGIGSHEIAVTIEDVT